MARLERLIAQIPGDDGWWRSINETKFKKAAYKLVDLGMTEEEAVAFLADLYKAVSNELGE